MEAVIVQPSQAVKAEALTADIYRRYIAYLDASPKTITTYTSALKQLYRYLFFNGISKPVREDIIAFRDDLRASGHKPTTVQNYIIAARLFFSWTAQEGIYPNIAEHLKGARIDKEHKRDYLTAGQVKAVLEAIDRSTQQGLRDYAIITLMVTGGLRTVEISRANIEDLRTAGGNSVLYVQGKGREEKTDYIRLSAPVEKAVRDYLKTARANAAGQDPLFTSLSNNSQGQRISTRTASGIVKARLRAAGFNSDRLTAHSLRHTAVTLSLLAGKDITEVQQFARHSNIATTMIYNHALDKARNGCGEAITKAIF